MTTTTELTPLEERDGRFYKREDLYRAATGVNGMKLRACQFLIRGAVERGATEVISAASVHSPQNAMAATVAREAGVPCTVIVGGTTMGSALTHPSIALAVEQKARLKIVSVGYNPYLQAAARDLSAERPGAYWLRYGITPPPPSTRDELIAFHAVGADQVRNLSPRARTLVMPFGSGNSAASVLYGLANYPAHNLDRVILMGIGPDRRPWLTERMRALGLADLVTIPKGDRLGHLNGTVIEHIDLHGSGFATYGQKMRETLDGIVLHPTYEGKIARYLNETRPPWWSWRDGSTALWIVGGPLPKVRP